MKTGNVVLGVLAGAAAGALLGILFAPEKGTRIRRQILRKGENLADDLKDKYDEFLDTITENYECTRKEAEELVSKGKAKYDEAKKEMADTTA